ncbi:hypothetical protein MPEAHAMD_2424 [Methylobacterium frigidaeris]|uniref:Uncharacterized protein n=1 Tax=Methylobacterium frigidaeris TaxID=2038277 RepID=A0AA37HB78_9HYPH|nr:hypothetical protein MPEAHAMD_2424 [Methylobacterium frigidaeris]
MPGGTGDAAFGQGTAAVTGALWISVALLLSAGRSPALPAPFATLPRGGGGLSAGTYRSAAFCTARRAITPIRCAR